VLKEPTPVPTTSLVHDTNTHTPLPSPCGHREPWCPGARWRPSRLAASCRTLSSSWSEEHLSQAPQPGPYAELSGPQTPPTPLVAGDPTDTHPSRSCHVRGLFIIFTQNIHTTVHKYHTPHTLIMLIKPVYEELPNHTPWQPPEIEEDLFLPSHLKHCVLHT